MEGASSASRATATTAAIARRAHRRPSSPTSEGSRRVRCTGRPGARVARPWALAKSGWGHDETVDRVPERVAAARFCGPPSPRCTVPIAGPQSRPLQGCDLGVPHFAQGCAFASRPPLLLFVHWGSERESAQFVEKQRYRQSRSRRQEGASAPTAPCDDCRTALPPAPSTAVSAKKPRASRPP